MDPDAWWLGQFIGYLMKPNKMFQEILSEAEKNIDFSSPIVGVHFRLLLFKGFKKKMFSF